MHPLPPIDPPSLSLTGLTLGGRYCIEHRVGAGGMAHVYFARDLESKATGGRQLGEGAVNRRREIATFGGGSFYAIGIDPLIMTGAWSLVPTSACTTQRRVRATRPGEASR